MQHDLIRPFRALRPAEGHADAVVAPPYDVLNSEEARRRAEGRPWSFLHISKAEIDLPEGTSPYAPEVYAKAAENLQRMLSAGVLRRDRRACYYVYRMRAGEHVQTGLACVGSVAAYSEQLIRRHEFTRPAKEDDRVRQIAALNAQTGPVLLTYRSQPELAELLRNVTRDKPVYDVKADDGVRHMLWVVADAALIRRVTNLVNELGTLYIADGHHRSAAAERVAASRREANSSHTGDEDYNFFLCVAFPHDEMRVLDYNRLVRDLNGQTVTQFMGRLEERFRVTPVEGQSCPARPGQFGMYIGGRWHRLEIHQELLPSHDPLAQLDVSLLQQYLLEPLLGIGDPRVDARIDFVGGSRGYGELERRVDSREMAVAFTLRPTPLEALMAVADAGEVMPPKSTWFEPKLADGLLSHVLDD